jgi:mono/diheme cytochrome c family protein
MNHRIVTRVVIGITVLCIAAALSFARLRAAPATGGSGPASPQAAAHPGAALFDTYCGSCHEAGAVAAPLRGPAGAARAQGMVEFLRRHGKSGDAQDRLIVEYLTQQAAVASPPR